MLRQAQHEEYFFKQYKNLIKQYKNLIKQDMHLMVSLSTCTQTGRSLLVLAVRKS
jgi:hypothetical protein